MTRGARKAARRPSAVDAARAHQGGVPPSPVFTVTEEFSAAIALARIHEACRNRSHDPPPYQPPTPPPREKTVAKRWTRKERHERLGDPDRAKRHADTVAATLTLYANVLRKMAPRIPAEQTWRALQWAQKIEKCGSQVWLHKCVDHNRIKTVCACCHVSVCPRHQRRLATRWHERIRILATLFIAASHAGYSWKMITVSPRQAGTFSEKIEKCFELRRKFARKLRLEYGMLAGMGAIEIGEHGNVHFHFVGFTKFLDRARLVSWLRAQDCTIPGCAHFADDRCDACKIAKCSCEHRDPFRYRQRCNGSFVVDIRACYAKDREGKPLKGHKGSLGIEAALEAVKYAAAPQVMGEAPRAGVAPTPSQEAGAELLLAFHLAMHGRHRVETYEGARTIQPGEDLAADDVEPDSLDETDRRPVCPVDGCGKRMPCIAFGRRHRDHNVWERPETAPKYEPRRPRDFGWGDSGSA